MLKDGSDWLEEKRTEHASRAVTYHRGLFEVEVQATIGKTVFEIDDGTGILEKVESRDYLVPAAELVLGGSQVLPERGDRIRVTDGQTVHVYEVMSPGGEMSHYEPSGPYRKAWRIHTKHVDTEVV